MEKNRYGYSAMGQEQGIFEISDAGIINTITDNVNLRNRYDKKVSEKLIKEIKEIAKSWN